MQNAHDDEQIDPAGGSSFTESFFPPAASVCVTSPANNSIRHFTLQITISVTVMLLFSESSC